MHLVSRINVTADLEIGETEPVIACASTAAVKSKVRAKLWCLIAHVLRQMPSPTSYVVH